MMTMDGKHSADNIDDNEGNDTTIKKERGHGTRTRDEDKGQGRRR